jgi:hypothetical protein
MALENPTFKPDFEKFQKLYADRGAAQKFLVLQGHPPAWYTDERWNGFLHIVEFLRSQGCVFMTPSHYLATLQPTRPTARGAVRSPLPPGEG